MVQVLSSSDLGSMVTFWMGTWVTGYGFGFTYRWLQGLGEKL